MVTPLFQGSLMDAESELDQSFAPAGIPEVAQLLAQSGTPVPIETISAVYVQKEWDGDRCLSRQELSEVALACGLHAWNSPMESADRQPLGDDSLASAEDPERVQVATSESLSLAEAIILREQKGQFPLIQPGELEEDSQIVEFATHVMMLLRPQDQVQLQIFLKNKYNQYQLTSCDSLESTQAQCLLAFSRDSYFQNIFEFLLIETLRTRSFRHCFQENKFVPLVPCSILTNPTSQSEAIERLRRVVDIVSALRDPNGPFTFCTCFDSEL
jgi:hypothetical protein